MGSRAACWAQTCKPVPHQIDRSLEEVPRKRSHPQGDSHKESELHFPWQTGKVDIHREEKEGKKKIDERVIDIDPVADLAGICQRLELEDCRSNAAIA